MHYFLQYKHEVLSIIFHFDFLILNLISTLSLFMLGIGANNKQAFFGARSA